MSFFRKKTRDADPTEPPAGCGADPPPSIEASGRGKGFFDLEPGEVPGFEPRGEVIARRPPFDLGPPLKLAAALLVLAAIVAGAVLLWPSSTSKVPNLVGRTLERAIKEARGSHLEPTVTSWRYSEEQSDGVVLAQSLKKGAVVGRGTRISLTVCKGPSPESGGATASGSASPSGGRAAAEQVITIDPGHQALPSYGEWMDPDMNRRSAADPGGKGTLSGNSEHEITMDIANKLKNLLEKDGQAVLMTREDGTVETPNPTRAEMANNAKSVLAVHIHCGNSGDPADMGVRTMCPVRNNWTAGFYEKSKTAALFIQEQLVRSCGLEDLGVLATNDLPEFNWSKVPTVEPQIGFLTNPRDDGLLAEEQFRWKVAWGLRNGIKKFLENQ